MYKIQKYQVMPKLPESLFYLKKLSHNLYWSWDHQSRSLFRRLEPELWEKTNRNPVLLLGTVDQERLEKMGNNEGFISSLERVRINVESYLHRKTWFSEQHASKEPFSIAYFSMEYGLANALPIYSGGLGVLAADHLKSASDLGLCLTGVGLLYQNGYFQQYLSSEGWQQETYPVNDFYNLPLTLVKNDKGEDVTITLNYPNGPLTARAWKTQVGRISIYFLDTNLDQNNDEDRNITDQLYGGDNEMRVKQEILLGIGGMRLLKKLGIDPTVCHMNEGHSAFLALERLRGLMKYNGHLSFYEACEAIRCGNIFTTHTPVPAGIDEFDPAVIKKYLKPFYSDLGLSDQEFLELGGAKYTQTNGKFNMAIFAINMASAYNGVSQLHGRVSRGLWNYKWPEVPEDEVPISHVTNGIHIRTWISEDMAELFNRYLGPNWYRDPVDESRWERINHIPNEELWRTHERRRERLVALSRQRLYQQLSNSGMPIAQVEVANEVLNPEALTIGFGRRFAEYKRAYLMFRDLDRLRKILNNKEQPVQIIISGKAHPHDKIGKGIIRDIINIIRQEDFRSRIVFLENYDMNIAAYLVQGVDVWLNTPRRNREASGTSGMKAGANGALNLSTLDGWWEEAYEMNMNIGWALGRGENYADEEEKNQIESEELYDILEKQVVPLFYSRNRGGLPKEWIGMMKDSMRTICPFFNTNRMVRTYFQSYYQPAAERFRKANENGQAGAKELAEWRRKIDDRWKNVRVINVKSDNSTNLKIGDDISVNSQVELGSLKPDDVKVEVYYGPVDEKGKIREAKTVAMKCTKQGNPCEYHSSFPADKTGRMGYTVRIIPYHTMVANPFELGLIKWYK